nr:DrmE family protein [Clostridium senegalense]
MSIENKLKNNVFYEDKLLDMSKYELSNIKILKEMFKNEDRINLLITPDKEAIEALLLIVLAIKLYIKNLKDEDENILEVLRIGDIVIYQGKKTEYLGIYELDGEKKIKLKYKENKVNGIKMEGAINYIRISDYYKLSIYRGDSKKLSTMSNKKSNKRNGKYVLADMLDIKLQYLGNTIKEQMVIVYPSKNKLEELLKKIKIRIKNKKYLFTEIFPCKYYSSIDNSMDLKGNKLKLKEIFVFTSNLSIARDVIQENKEISNLLLLGQDTYVNEIGGSLDFLLKRKKLKKIYILNTFDKINQLHKLLESGFNVQLNAWTRAAFLKDINEIDLYQICLKNKKIDLFLNRKVENKLMNQYKDITENLLKLKIDLIEVLKEDFYCDNKEIFLRISYGLLKIFEKIIVPIKEYDDFITDNNLNNYTVDVLIEKLMDIVKENEFYEDNYRVLYNISQSIKNLYELMYYKNPKFNFLKSINLSYGDLIICNSSIEKAILKKYEYIKNKYIRVSTIKNYKDDNNFQKIIFTGVYDNKNLDQVYCFNSLNIVNLLYPSEVSKYNSKVNKFNKLFNLIEEKNSLGNSNDILKLQNIKIDYNEFIEKYTVQDDTIEKTETEIEKKLYFNEEEHGYKESLEYDLDIEDLLNIDLNNSLGKQFLEDDTGIVKKKINFKDKKYALLTTFYKSKCIDNTNNSIVKKDINALQIGDKLIFIYDTEDEITKLFYKIMCSDKFKSKYYKHYNNMKYWKDLLKKYIESYFCDYSLIALELSFYKINRTEQAIKAWIVNENIIGPTEKEVYNAIAKITNDKYLLEHWEEIYESCNLIRSLKTKLKDNFNSMVIQSVVNEKSEGEFENLVYDVLGDLKKYSEIEEIYDIEDILINIPINKTNCILEKRTVSEIFKINTL